MEYSDRYGGQNYPDPNTVCDGPCEGLGVYPEYQGEVDEDGMISLDTLAVEGMWIMVTCPDCNGTGKKSG